MKNLYEDMIDLPRHKSSQYPQMARLKRAAQFAPFAALTGHQEAVCEAARVTDPKVDLDEYIRRDLNERLQILKEHIDQKPETIICYFQKDPLKEGGASVTACGRIKKIDEYKGLVIMEDGKEIEMGCITQMDCQLFKSLMC